MPRTWMAAGLAAGLLAANSAALAASSIKYDVWAGVRLEQGTVPVQDGESKTFVREFTSNAYNIRLEGEISPAVGRATVRSDGSTAVFADVEVNVASNLELVPPADGFARVAGGKVVLMIEPDGAWDTGCGCVALVTLAGLAGPVTRSLAVGDFGIFWEPVSPVMELALPLPNGPIADGSMQVLSQIKVAFAYERRPPTWGNTVTAGLKLAGFRVLDASGAQVKGFRMLPSGLVPEFDPSEWMAAAVEYFNPSYGTYFMTHLPQEISDLDSGRTPGWQRTGESFNVWKRAPKDTVEVCRFYGVFGSKSSHFYAARGLGCEALLPADLSWQFEGNLFHTYPAEHGCPLNNLPIYRFFNNGQGGVPNHRFTTSQAIRDEMSTKGWYPEGVVMCSPQ